MPAKQFLERFIFNKPYKEEVPILDFKEINLILQNKKYSQFLDCRKQYISDAFLSSSRAEDIVRTTITGVPVYLFNEHQWALYSWHDAAEEGYIPRYGNVLMHVDAHCDLVTPRSDVSPLDKESVAEYIDAGYLNCANFIVPAMNDGMIKEFVWVIPEWEFGEQTDRMKENLSIFISERLRYGRYSVVTSREIPSYSDGSVILDIDWDYFSLAQHKGSNSTREQIDRRVSDFTGNLKRKGIRPSIITGAYSDQDDIFTPHEDVEYITSRLLKDLEHMLEGERCAA